MTEIINVGIKVDSSGVVQGVTVAEQHFNRLNNVNDKAQQKTNGLMSSFMSLKGAITLVAGSAVMGALINVTREMVQAAGEAEMAEQKLGAVIKATGNAAGLTARQYADLAEEIHNTTLFDDDAALSAMAIMGTFRNVQGETFREGVKLATDMATVLETDLKSAALQLGKALNDPVLGVSALSRAGVQFNEAQKEMIRQMVESGNVAGAQALVLEELKKQIGGVASGAHGDNLHTSTTELSKAWGEMLESWGQTEGIGGRIKGLLGDLTGALQSLTIETDPQKMRDTAEAVHAQRRDELIRQRKLLEEGKRTGNAALDNVSLDQALRIIDVEISRHDTLLEKLDREQQMHETNERHQREAADAAAERQRKQAAADAELAKQLEAQKKAQEEAKRAAEQRAEAIRTTVAGLEDEAATLGLNNEELELYRLRQLGATDADIARAEAAAKAIAQYRAALKAQEELEKAEEAREQARKARQQAVNDLLKSLQREIDTHKMSRAELAAYEAAQAGASYLEIQRARELGKLIDEQERLAEEARKQAEAFDTTWGRALENLQDAFAGFFEKLGQEEVDEFGEFINTLLSMWKRLLAEIAASEITAAAGSFVKDLLGIGVQAAVGGATGGGAGMSDNIGSGVPVDVAHAGGVVGNPMGGRKVPAAVFAGAPRFHGGGIAGLGPNEVPIIAEKGERIIPKGAGGGGSVTNIHQAVQFSINALDARSVAQLLEEQAGTIVGLVAKAAQESRGFRSMIQGG